MYKDHTIPHKSIVVEWNFISVFTVDLGNDLKDYVLMAETQQWLSYSVTLFAGMHIYTTHYKAKLNNL